MAHLDPVTYPVLSNPYKLVTQRNTRYKQASSSLGSPFLKKAIVYEFESKEDFPMFKNPIRSYVDHTLGKGKSLIDLKGMGLSFSKGKP